MMSLKTLINASCAGETSRSFLDPSVVDNGTPGIGADGILREWRPYTDPADLRR